METGKLTKTDIITSLQESMSELEKLVKACDDNALDQSLGRGSGQSSSSPGICMIQKKSGQNG
ncbi:hypothetical protein ACVNSY_11425 [Bacillus sp. OHL2]